MALDLHSLACRDLAILTFAMDFVLFKKSLRNSDVYEWSILTV